MEREIQKMLVVSTAHISKDDNFILSTFGDAGGPTCLVVDQYPYGYIVWVGSYSSDEDYPVQIVNEGMSKEFIALMELAEQLDCEYLKVDADGPIYDDLPTFEW